VNERDWKGERDWEDGRERKRARESARESERERKIERKGGGDWEREREKENLFKMYVYQDICLYQDVIAVQNFLNLLIFFQEKNKQIHFVTPMLSSRSIFKFVVIKAGGWGNGDFSAFQLPAC
jgi:hypothetical protein